MFSNGIIVLTILALALLFAVGHANDLVPFYAISVFTGFSIASYDIVRYHLRQRETGWRRGWSSTSLAASTPRWS